ncbi:phosphatase PAP2 family protein [Paludibaculum fermentans]|uniref:phosphatase PAP2 family protein n=1 Tax=Paludibaculum fermentans TaxID=1473598 RepID=UPI003EB9F401
MQAPPFFPPWGQQTVEDVAATQENLGVPPHWKINQNLGAGALRNTWNTFISKTLQEIGAVLWPPFSFQDLDWPPGTVQQRLQLTEADLLILLELQNRPVQIIDELISSPVSGPVVSKHRVHFEREDQSSLGRLHAEYDASLPPDLFAQIPLLIVEGLNNKSASTAKQLKRNFQRPRAYQMATLSGIHNYKYLHADTADSPSMVSGHSLAGTIAVGTVIDTWIKNKVRLSQGSWIALQQYAVDIGDRRVYAGVHYPGDNLASWITTMKLGKEVFESPQTLQHLYDAITKNSYVYSLIVKSRHIAYEPALELLHSLKP